MHEILKGKALPPGGYSGIMHKKNWHHNVINITHTRVRTIAPAKGQAHEAIGNSVLAQPGHHGLRLGCECDVAECSLRSGLGLSRNIGIQYIRNS
jgi:hypothetical protein